MEIKDVFNSPSEFKSHFENSMKSIVGNVLKSHEKEFTSSLMKEKSTNSDQQNDK